MPQVVVTLDEAANIAGVIFGVILALPIAIPFIAPAGLAAVYVYEEWGWHVLFAIMIGLIIFAATYACVVALLCALPRHVSIGLIALYIGGVYGVCFHEDIVWAVFVGLIAGGIGIGIGIDIMDRLGKPAAPDGAA